MVYRMTGGRLGFIYTGAITSNSEGAPFSVVNQPLQTRAMLKQQCMDVRHQPMCDDPVGQKSISVGQCCAEV